MPAVRSSRSRSETTRGRAPVTGLPGPRPPVTELPADDVFTTLETSRRGLSRTQAEDRLRTHGGNELPRAAPRAVWRQLAAQFTDLFAVMLLAASGMTFLAYVLEEPRDAGTLTLAVAIPGVVGLNAAIGFAQEYSAERTPQALEAMVPHTCRVLRDGRSSRPSSATAGPPCRTRRCVCGPGTRSCSCRTPPRNTGSTRRSSETTAGPGVPSVPLTADAARPSAPPTPCPSRTPRTPPPPVPARRSG
ncbi:cation-transporting P-type ATPase [Streptomyces sp. XHT-2]|uniref:cation-transporting P-type ATPase n=1 Tax=Streptomyces sp. XHT-2 TaxID=2692621 RepID=UPI00307BA7E1